jgi:hypothetical protein
MNAPDTASGRQSRGHAELPHAVPAFGVFDKMAADDRWSGFGYLGERRNVLASIRAGERPAGELEALADIDERVLAHAERMGLDYEGLFAWANSKHGRWLADVTLGGSGPVSERWDEAVRHGLAPGAS